MDNRIDIKHHTNGNSVNLHIAIPEKDDNPVFTDTTVFPPGCSTRFDITFYHLTAHDIGELSHRLTEIYQELVMKEDSYASKVADAQELKAEMARGQGNVDS